jgi:hypothetical protein
MEVSGQRHASAALPQGRLKILLLNIVTKPKNICLYSVIYSN